MDKEIILLKVSSALLTLTERQDSRSRYRPGWDNNCPLSVGKMNRILAGNLAYQSATLLASKSHERKEKLMGQVMNSKTESNTFTKRIGQTTYVVRFHYNENARETMQEKINRMLVNEVNRSGIMETEEKMAE